MKDHSYPDESNKPSQLRKAHGKAERGIRTGKETMAGYYGVNGKKSSGKHKKMDYSMKKGKGKKMDYHMKGEY